MNEAGDGCRLDGGCVRGIVARHSHRASGMANSFWCCGGGRDGGSGLLLHFEERTICQSRLPFPRGNTAIAVGLGIAVYSLRG
jgi:hypothetical protein